MTELSSGWLGAAESALRAAPPTRLLSTARSLLAAYLDARWVSLLLADYGLTSLQPVACLPHTGEAVPVPAPTQTPADSRTARTLARRADQ